MNRFKQIRFWLTMMLGVVFGMAVIQTVWAAEFESVEVYRLPAGEVITDDLYIAASEIYIDGTVEGDLIAAASTIVINGTITGDAMLGGASIQINGQIEGDMRAGGTAIEVTGTIGEDMLAAGGGGPMVPQFTANQFLASGVRLSDRARVGGDVILAGGSGTIAGTIDGDLWLGMATATLAAQVAGDARIASDAISVTEPARIAGVVRYTSTVPNPALEAIATTAEYAPPTQEQRPDPVATTLAWLFRTLLVLAGFALLAWLTLRFAPRLLTEPAGVLATQPARSGLYGLLASLLFIFLPLASVVLVFVMVVFWGWFPGIVLGVALFGVLSMLWLLSPLITGLWVGRWLTTALGREANDLTALLGGVLLLALLGRIPVVGWVISLVSFVLALGALIVARRAAGGGSAVQTVGTPLLVPTQTT